MLNPEPQAPHPPPPDARHGGGDKEQDQSQRLDLTADLVRQVQQTAGQGAHPKPLYHKPQPTVKPQTSDLEP